MNSCPTGVWSTIELHELWQDERLFNGIWCVFVSNSTLFWPCDTVNDTPVKHRHSCRVRCAQHRCRQCLWNNQPSGTQGYQMAWHKHVTEMGSQHTPTPAPPQPHPRPNQHCNGHTKTATQEAPRMLQAVPKGLSSLKPISRQTSLGIQCWQSARASLSPSFHLHNQIEPVQVHAITIAENSHNHRVFPTN